MPTESNPLPSESHRARAVAESFGVDAARYDRSRPRYPEEVLTAILAASPGREVLDVGTGTGIVAARFAAAGCAVLGVEPDPRMAEFARGRGIEVEESTFEEWDPRGRRFDAVVAGQTWHWVDPEAGARQARRVLRPGGHLALFWNVSAPPPALRDAFAEVYLRVLPEWPMARMAAAAGPQTYTAMSDKASEGMRRAGGFGAARVWGHDWAQDYTRAQWLELSATTGITTRLPKADLDRVLAGLGEVIDGVGGHFVCEYRTVVVSATAE